MVRDHVDIIGLEAHTFHIMCTTTTVLADVHMLWFIVFIRYTGLGGWHENGNVGASLRSKGCELQGAAHSNSGALCAICFVRSSRYFRSMQAKTWLAFWLWFSYTAQRRLSSQRVLKSHKMAVWCQYKRCTLRDLQGRFSKWLVLVLNEELHGLAIAWT